MPRKLQLKRLSEFSPRDLLMVGLPALALLAGGFWLAAQFIKPAPPDYLYISSGGAGGSYQLYVERYRQVLGKNGIELREQPSAGSLENLKRLLDEDDDTEVALVQSGTANGVNVDSLLSLGYLYYEPLWIFYRDKREFDRLAPLKGSRIAIGAEGSGTRKLAQQLLEANGLDEQNTTLLPLGGLAAVEAMQAHKVDAVFLVGAERSAAVWSLLYAEGVRLMSLTHAEAYVRRFPYLARLTLPQGAIDLTRNIPARDVTLVSPMATLVAHESIHPALIQLLLQAAQEVHGEAGIFQRPGEFPRIGQADFPVPPEAERFYKSGKPFLQRYLPFWAANLIDRMVVMLVPFVALLLPILRFAPGLYSWRVRSRIYRRYGELKFLEADVEASPERHSRAEWLEKLDRIEEDVQHIPTPLAFADMLYTLRLHVGLVRATILRRAPADKG
ncbi:MAG: ABC transporter substrate-binding protein [Betaproteobacteria bacterium]|jgi:TRAP transporter TAXI family solute receptor|nr:ABC transporter substrate-binding protein [Betaproteobacteria bacterium]